MQDEHLLELAVSPNYLYELKSGTTEQLPRCLIGDLRLGPDIVQTEPLKPVRHAVVDDAETESASPTLGEHHV
jgi:hypothetical protein